MSTGLLFVTAPNADTKIINRFLLHARDWEFGDEDSWDNFYLVTTKNDPNLSKFKDSRRNELPATKPGDLDPSTFTNEWADASIKDIENYVQETDTTGMDGDAISLFLILDTKSIADKTCIIAEKYIEWNDDADPPEPIPKEEREKKHGFNKYRVPWDETYIVWCNLNIGNEDFEDFVDDDGDEGCDGEGWWRFRGHGSLLEEEQEERREGVLKRFEEEGKI